MTASVKLERYTSRKTHICGCITVWDTRGGGARYIQACCIHRGYAERFKAEPKE